MYELTHEQRLKLINHIGSGKIFLDFIGEKSVIEFDIPEKFLKHLTNDFNVEQILRILQAYIFGLSQSEIEKYANNFKGRHRKKWTFYEACLKRTLIYVNYDRVADFTNYFVKSEVFQDFAKFMMRKYPLDPNPKFWNHAKEYERKINNPDIYIYGDVEYVNIFWGILGAYSLEQLLRIIWGLFWDYPYYDFMKFYENPNYSAAEMDARIDYKERDYALNWEYENVNKKLRNELETALEKVRGK